MNDFEKLYKKDQNYINRLQKDQNNKKFLESNKKIREELEEILNKTKTLTPRQRFICAMIYHHGFTIEYSKKALKYIKEAQAEGYQRQEWLIASIIDRLLQLEGKPQKYGTQIIKLKNGKYKQYKLDNSISDEERVKLGLPRLKELKRDLEK